jgi:hypothetical protein
MPFASDTLVSQYDVRAINIVRLKLDGGRYLCLFFCEDISSLLMARDVILT